LDADVWRGRHAGGRQRAGEAPVGRPHVQPAVDDVTADRIALRLGQRGVAMLLPEWIYLGRPAVVVRVGEAAIARESLTPVDVAILARDAADLMVALRQVGDDLSQLPVDTADFPNVLGILRNVDLVVLRAVADGIHDAGELADADVLEGLAVLVEHLDGRTRDRALEPLCGVLGFEGAEEVGR